MSNPKPPTPQGISALLKRAGFERSSGGSAGYTVHGYAGRFSDVVIFNPGNDDSMEAWERYLSEAEEELARCAQTITAAGFAVEFKYRPVPKLVVTAGKPGTSPTETGEESR